MEGIIARPGESTVLRAGVNLNATVQHYVFDSRTHLLKPTKTAGFFIAYYDDPAGSQVIGWDVDGEPRTIRAFQVADFSHSLDAAWRAVRHFFNEKPEQRDAFFRSLQRQSAGYGEWTRWPYVLVELADRLPEALCQALIIAIRGEV